MNKITQIVIIISLISLLSGCLESKEEYFSTGHNETITLYPDGTFTAIQEKHSASGTYRIDGDTVVLTLTPFGTVKSFTKNSSGLCGYDGDCWGRVQ